MALAPGTRLGHYEIVSAIGAGGMGEVYRAIDTTLKRTVAIKVLPDALAADAERLARLQREAEVLASLNHPQIAQIYGLEKGDPSTGSGQATTALVLEYVDGPTLADRLAEGAIPIDDALPIARQIAEALEAAHEQGIVHRDLKPANVKLRPDGQAKVLDFGLAKLATRELAPSGPAGLTASPTLTIHATYLGVILGTAAYMSPEQAKGKVVDRRADIWAFGVVLCEMLTGRRMYDGETAAETMARIIERDPDLSGLPSTTPVAVRTVLERCLTKDPRARLQAIGEARIVLDRVIAQPQSLQENAPDVSRDVSSRRRGDVAAWVLAGVLAITLAVLLGLWAPWRRIAAPALVRVNTDIGADASLSTDVGTAAVLSPNGQILAFAARPADRQTSFLYVRRLDQLVAAQIPGTDDARAPFFSPDGQTIAFFAGGKLKRVAVVGGSVATIADAPLGRGGSWAEDGTITFQPNIGSGRASLARVPSAGGDPVPMKPEENGRARFPQALPGGVVLYTKYSPAGPAGAGEVRIELPDGQRRSLFTGGYGRYVRSGHLVYLHDNILYAVAFDLERLQPIGQPVPVLEGVMASQAMSGAQFSVSDTGTLAYLAGGTPALETPAMSWLDASGKVTPLLASGRNWNSPRFSPDGTRIAVEMVEGTNSDIWTYDIKRDSLDRVTFDARALETEPLWTPDGLRIVFRKGEGAGAAPNLYWERADLTGGVQRLTESPFTQTPGSFHPSGKFLAFSQTSNRNSPDIWILPMEGDEKSGWKPGTPTALIATEANENNPQFSPDGKWLAYISNASGPFEVYVRPFPGAGGPWQISTGGGQAPEWSKSKPELLYSTINQEIMVAPYRVEGGGFQRDRPRPWPKARYVLRGPQRSFDLHPDGNRLVLALAPENQGAVKRDKLILVFNFFDELRRLVPVSGK
jgi:Tol biopolymer transport system component